MQADILSWGLTAWLAAVAAIVGYRMLVGQIAIAGLTRRKEGESIDPERIVLLLTSIAGALSYGVYALSTGAVPIEPATVNDTAGQLVLPEVPDGLLATVGGSQLLYLTGKLSRSIYQGGKE